MSKSFRETLVCMGASIGINGYGAWYRLNRYRKNMYQTMHRWQSLMNESLEELERRQGESLRGVFEAARNSPYYQRIIEQHDVDLATGSGFDIDSLKQFPFLNRSDVIQFNDDLRNQCFDEPVVQKRSSGTTGHPVSFLQPRKMAFDETYAMLYGFYQWHGILPLGRRASFVGRALGRSKNGVVLNNRFENQLVLGIHALTLNNVGNYAEAIRRYQPRLVQGHPSALKMFVEYCRRKNIRIPSVFRLAFTGETLLEEDRILIEEAFCGRLFGTYGMGENCVAACECEEQNGYHINPMVGVVELDKNSGCGAEIVATSLLNHAMPFLRYRTGDMAERIDYDPCPCGVTWPRLIGLMGRSDDIIYTTEGVEILPIVLRTEIRQKFQINGPYSIVLDTDSDDVTFRVFSDEGTPECHLPICSYLSERLGPKRNVVCEVVPYTEFLTARAKHKIVIRE